MSKLINILLALAIATLASTAHAVEPKEMQSLKPFQSFAKGAGEGVAREYIPRDKAQFVAWMRAQKGMRTTCEVLVRQMAEAHPGLPFEGCEGAAAAIEQDSDFAVVACEDQMFTKDNWLAVTNERGSAWGVWHRKCLAKEQVLVYKGQPLISTTCGNVAVPTPRIIVTIQSAPAPAAPQVLAPATTTPAMCPAFYFLKVNVWEHKALDLPGVGATHAIEENGQDEFAKAIHVSRKHGGQFRKALVAEQVARATTPRMFRVSLIMTPESTGGSPTITAEEVLGDVLVTGLFELRFGRAQLDKWDAIRIVAVNGDVTSPPRHRLTGVVEVRFFNHLLGTKLGEWEKNPVPDCIMNEHWIE